MIESILTLSLYIIIAMIRDNIRDSISEKVMDIKHSYRRKSYSHAEDVLMGVVTKIDVRMRSKCKNVKTSCPNGNELCDYPNKELAQELILYYTVVNNIFMVDIRQKVNEAIRENGFLQMDQSQLERHIRSKGERFYDLASTKVVTILGGHVPLIAKYLGSTYTKEEAISDFREVVDKAIYNTLLANKEIAEIKKGNNYINTIFKMIRGMK